MTRSATSPKAILFDVMSTVVEDPFHHHLPAFFGMSLEELLAAKHPQAWQRFERDEWDEQTFLRHFFADGRDYDHEGLRKALFEHYRWLPGMEILVSQLQQDRVALHWVSNYPHWYREIDRRLGLHQYAAWTFVSCHEGLRKPDPAAYRIVLERGGLRPEDCVFVDDVEENCASARRLGIDSIRFEGSEALYRALEQRGLFQT